jgi:peptide chain release factor 2
VDAKVKRIEEIDKRIADSAFWEGTEEAQSVLRERTALLGVVDQWQGIKKDLEDGAILLQLAEEEEDEKEIEGVQGKLDQIEKQIRDIELGEILGGKHDPDNAIVNINAGAGGTEAQDWAEMLLRMYLKWAENKGCKSEIIDILAGEEAGIKNVTFTISGDYAYGYLKAEPPFSYIPKSQRKLWWRSTRRTFESIPIGRAGLVVNMSIRRSQL